MHRAPGTSSAPRNVRGGEPSRRALDAMASAARRAQRADGKPPVIDQGNQETGVRRLVARSTRTSDTRRLVARTTTSGDAQRAAAPMPTGPGHLPPVPRVPPVPADPHGSAWTHAGADPGVRAPGARPPSRWSEWRAARWAEWSDRRGIGRARWTRDSRPTRTLLSTGAVAILIVAVAGIGLALALRSPANPATSRTGAARRPSVSHRSATLPAKGSKTGGKATHGKEGTKGGPPPTTPTTTSPTTSVTPAPTGAPRLSSASPSSGAAGQTVVVDGSGLFSSNGEVLAYFGGTDAPTSCSSQTSCTVTVPDLGAGPTTVPLTIVTSRGRSNALRFSYR